MTTKEDGGGEDDDMDFDDWTSVGRGRGRGKEKVLKEGRVIGSQNSKRNLEECSSDEENRAVRKKVTNEEFKVILKFRNEDMSVNLSPIQVSREIKKKLGEVEFVKTLRDGNMLIKCKSEEQKNKCMQIDNICKKVVREKLIVGENRVSRGVITGFTLEEALERLKKNIQGGEVRRLKRLQKHVNGEKIESLSILLEFQGEVLPDKVKIGFMSFSVRPYVPPPLRCFKCQRYGHIAAVCKGKQRCAKCGGDHRYDECGVDVQMKCCNCGGQHNVAFGGCEARKKAAEIQQLRTIKKITYAEAAKSVQEKRTVQKSQQVMSSTSSEPSQILKSGMEITMDKLILFMAYVINCTDQVKQKTEKI
ncbi:uncharacterized protein LOC106512216 [Austrofundulus limnaeus]|uniref:Uncharacterized protein LOC106512216 n=1 Tax=Austrofundulus limnaeus TaxID=52670 RepID=A0A2I4ALH6_AUSLI|nr:PREDICTED: uncharacterized protein LOC106512216 [Austrofundulus limnaeus]